MRIFCNRLFALALAIACLLPASARALDYDKLYNFDIAGVSLATPLDKIDPDLKAIGYIADPVTNSGDGQILNYHRPNTLLSYVEKISVEMRLGQVFAVTYSKEFEKITQRLSNWKDFPHASDIDYALIVLCQANAPSYRDCKDRKYFDDSAFMTTIDISARRGGPFGKIILARFNASSIQFTWSFKYANINE